MPRIRFTHTGHSHLIGNFAAGDLYTGSPEACRHFVDEARCAEWADTSADPSGAAPVQAPAPQAPAARKPRAKKKGA